MLMRILRKISILNPKFVSVFYLIYAVLLSIIFSYVHLPDSFFNQSSNFLNVYFMKYSYVYVTVALLPFTCILHYLLNYGDFRDSLFSILRIFIFAFVNYCIGEEFNILGFFYGICDMYSYAIDDQIECISSGYNWSKLDISGHVFHILLGILVTLEEIYFLKNWEEIEKILAKNTTQDVIIFNKNPITDISRENFQKFRILFNKLNCLINTLFAILAILVILLHLSIFLTLIYFHTVFEKVVATVVAIVFWYVTYHLIYPLSGFETGPYNIRTAEHDYLLGKNNEFNLISNDPGEYKKRGFFSIFVDDFETYEVL